MKRQCPNSECSLKYKGTASVSVIRKGHFWRASDSQWIARFQCKLCKKTFSSALFYPCYRQKRRKLNHRLMLLVSSGVSQRRAAVILGANRKTIVRKFRFLAQQARIEQELFLKQMALDPIGSVQLDDLETSEHTKCKPLSVALAVEPKTRKILGFSVSQMPAKGHLTQISFRKYGPRADERRQGWDALLYSLRTVINPEADWLTDQNPHYGPRLKQHFPKAVHRTTPGIRGSIGGQGELKKIGFDPLFALNHTCAMLRANMNRLFRKTWCTTKNKQGLIDHLSIYVNYHNQVLTE